jgi:NAD/NADP transhydrogenase beta subunit
MRIFDKFFRRAGEQIAKHTEDAIRNEIARRQAAEKLLPFLLKNKGIAVATAATGLTGAGLGYHYARRYNSNPLPSVVAGGYGSALPVAAALAYLKHTKTEELLKELRK